MFISSELDRLTKKMMERQPNPAAEQLNPDLPEPYILFLGTGCSQAAGVPSIEQIAERELSHPDISDSDPSAPRFNPDDKAGSVKSFYKWLEGKKPGHVFRIFQAHYASTPVPLFYQDLALLIKNNFFNRILTTNFDTLLEQALSGAGLIADVDYEVTSFGLTSRPDEPKRARSFENAEWAPARPREPVSIVKLHGDMAEGQLVIPPWQLEDLLKSKRHAAKEELKGDLIMVGYELESPKLNDWLSSYRKRELWWVAEQQRPLENWAEIVNYIDGPMGAPATFFSQLSLRLLRLPVLTPSPTIPSASGSNSESDVPAAEAETTPPTEQIVIDDLRGQIRRVQASLSSLEQKSSPDERPTSLQAQIDYQKQQLMSLEDQLRSLSTSWPHLLQLLKSMAQHLESAKAKDGVEHISDSTIDFFKQQCDLVANQYTSGEVNQQIISAAVAGAAILAERLSVELGGQVVTPEDVRGLASYVPTVATRGIK